MDSCRPARSGEENILVSTRNPAVELQPVVGNCIEEISEVQDKDLIDFICQGYIICMGFLVAECPGEWSDSTLNWIAMFN